MLCLIFVLCWHLKVKVFPAEVATETFSPSSSMLNRTFSERKKTEFCFSLIIQVVAFCLLLFWFISWCENPNDCWNCAALLKGFSPFNKGVHSEILKQSKPIAESKFLYFHLTCIISPCKYNSFIFIFFVINCFVIKFPVYIIFVLCDIKNQRFERCVVTLKLELSFVCSYWDYF